MMPDISIVVCTQNRAAMLRDALSSLYDLATDDRFAYEIIVIDNGSTDETPQAIAAAAHGSRSPLRGIYERQKGIVPARNRGIHEARGRWIAFFDDDQLADSRWLAELFAGAADKHCRVVGGSVHLCFPGCGKRKLQPTVRMLLGEANFGNQPLRYGGRLTPGCGNLMIERTVFDEVGTFARTVQGRGEDTDLFARIDHAGIEAWYFPRAVVQHLTPPERLADAYLLNLARRMGEGVALRQMEQLGSTRFTLLWLAKATRLAVISYPRLALARLHGDAEAALDQQCLAEINVAYLRTGCQAFQRPRQATAGHGGKVLCTGVNAE
jgi:glucosyl-dolichyl phosphate glucuronosyltransferase